MNFKLPLENNDSTTVFIRCIFHNIKQILVEDNVWSVFRQIGVRYNIGVVPYRLIFDESMLGKVKAFSSFGDVLIPWNNYRPDSGKRDWDGSTERCVLTELRENNESYIGDRVTMAFCFTSHLVSIKISLNFYGH
jgi:hypothetical protein